MRCQWCHDGVSGAHGGVSGAMGGVSGSSSIPAVLIHYLGNENLNVDFPHGNSKQNASDHHRTCPSLLHKMSTTVDLPSNVYKKAISSIKCPPELQPSK